MAVVPYRFPAQQEAFLRAMAEGSYRVSARTSRGPMSVSLVDRMPPVYQQALQGTCVANAVVALLEFYGDLKTRLSVQFLHAATKEIEWNGLVKNLGNLRTGGPLDAGFESVFHTELLQLRMLADANGGMNAPAVRPYLTRFDEAVRARFAVTPGSLLISCFRAVETCGVCRYALWPYASALAAPVFGESTSQVDFPPGTREDAAKRRILHGLYRLRTPNNVDEIRGILAGANGRRAMPVVVTVDFFAGCDGETYSFPRTREDADGHLISEVVWQGRHGLLVVGYVDNASYAGGGYFLIRNSLGEGWGNRGYGKLPYAYLECFALEAGTILQDRIDYEGDGYDGQRSVRVPGAEAPRHRGRRILFNLLMAAVIAAATIAIGVFFDDPLHLRRKPEVPSPPASPVHATTPVSAVSAANPRDRTVYKVFFSCENAEERKALREAMVIEGVPFPVEVLPQALETVLPLRVTMPEGDVYEEIAKILKAHYVGPRKEFWRDVTGLCRSRSIYIVKADVRRWDGGAYQQGKE